MKPSCYYAVALLWTALLLNPLPGLTQQKEDCSQTISRAEEYYNAGLFEQVLDLDMGFCIDHGFSAAEKSRALKVLVLIYLYRDQQDSALRYMQQLLVNDPEYAVDAPDPIEFRRLHERFDTDPVGMIEFRAGTNLTVPLRDPGGAYTVGPNEASQQSLFLLRPGFHLGVFWEEQLLKGLSVNAGLSYQYRSYFHQESLPYYDVFDPQGTNSFELTFFEQQHWLDLPVSLHLNFLQQGQARLVPFVSLGMVGHYLLSDRLKQVQRTLVNIPSNDKDKKFEKRILQVTTEEEFLTGNGQDLRTRINLSGQIGAGLQIKLGHNYLCLEAQGLWMTRNLVNGNNRFANSQLVYTYGYVDDDFVQIVPQFNVGLKHIFYNPRLK